MKGQPFLTRLGFALRGIGTAFRREASFRWHLLACAAVCGVLILARAQALWWAIAALTVGLVMVAELLNTAVETLADHLHPEQHPEIGAVKDIAAGAVLVASVVALVVALAFIVDGMTV